MPAGRRADHAERHVAAGAGSWTAAQLRTKLFESRHDVIFLAGHFSANSALAADFTTSVLTTDLAASTTDFTNSIVFSAGCHSGYNLVDGDAIPGVTLPLDWAQAFARKKATLIAGTGYQYGDTDFLEYSERLYNNFARQLRAGTAGTPIAVGEALVQAKLAYLAATPDIRGLHEKALLAGDAVRPADARREHARRPWRDPRHVAARSLRRRWPRVPPRPSASQTFDLGVAPSLTPRTQTLTNLAGRSRHHGQLAERPRRRGDEAGRARAAAGGGQRDAERSAASCCAASVTAAARTSTPGRWFRSPAPRRRNRAACTFPSCRRSSTRARCGRRITSERWPATAAPSFSSRRCSIAPPMWPTGRARSARTTGMNLRLFYSGNLSQAALSDAPSIVAVDAQQDASGVTFCRAGRR